MPFLGVIKVFQRYWNTIRYLRWVQIKERFKRKISFPTVDESDAGPLRDVVDSWTVSAMRKQSMVGEQSFCFLNESHDVVSGSDWNSEQHSKLWLYNLHYFDDLTAVDADRRIDWHRALIQRWIDENLSGMGNGWEPYPSSLRIVNWVKWAMAGNKLKSAWVHSLSVQVRYLSSNLETHLLGNHLFANAKALLFAGLFFDGNEAERWYQTGYKLIERELPEQVLADGGNFELSPMYHLIFLEDLLDLVNIYRAFGRKVPAGVEERIAPMFCWLETMCHPDGEISFFNDAALGVTPTVVELKSYLDRMSGLTGFSLDEKSCHVNLENLVDPVQGFVIDLSESGYSRVELDDAVALLDRAAVGPDYLPGHAHADTLSFELSLFGQRVVVNSGTSVYGASKQRKLERGTAAHATVVIDGENSSEVWGGFRVARRARVFDRRQSEADEVIKLSACHDGYKRLAGKPVHCREWLFENGGVTVSDTVTGRGEHEVVSLLPLHPEVVVSNIQSNLAQLEVDGKKIEVSFEGKGSLAVKDALYHPEFGISINNKQLIYTYNGVLPFKSNIKISW